MAAVAGTGSSVEADSQTAATEAAQRALSSAGLLRCDIALVFTTSKHDPKAIRDGLRAALGPETRIVGGYAVGVITNDYLGYDGYEVGVAVFSVSGEAKMNVFLETGLAYREEAVGEALGEQLAAADPDRSAGVVILYDSVNRTRGSYRMNMATPLLQGLEYAFGSRWPTLAGAGLSGDMKGAETFQWYDDEVLQQTALALTVSGSLRMDTVIMHGCRPASDYRTITATDGSTVLTIDDEPAIDVIAGLLGADSEKTSNDYAFFVTLGVNRGDKWGEFHEELYQNRLCLRVDRNRRGLVMFEPDLLPGDEVQLMTRRIDSEAIAERAAGLLATVAAAGRRPIFALYIDCAGRASAYSGIDEEDGVAVQFALGEVPLLGLYSGVEIAKVGDAPCALDWTGVLCVFSETEGA